MGDRYTIDISCAYCGARHEDIWYAPTCGSDTFQCERCGKTSFITADFTSKKLLETTVQDVVEGFDMCTNVSWSDADTTRICKEHLEDLRSEVNEKEDRI